MKKKKTSIPEAIEANKRSEQRMKEIIENFMGNNCNSCPRCGSQMVFDPLLKTCKCPACGYVQNTEDQE